MRAELFEALQYAPELEAAALEEAALGRVPERRGRYRRYLEIDDKTLVRLGYLPRYIASGRLRRASLGRLLKGLLGAVEDRGPIEADLLRVQNSLRLFYLADRPQYTVKAVFPDNRLKAEGLSRELEARKRFSEASGGRVRVPEVFRAQVAERPRFMVEEYLHGRKADPARDRAALCSLIDGLCDTYRALGVEWRELQSQLWPGELEQALETVANWTAKEGYTRLAPRVREAYRRTEAVPVAFTHGDLGLGNVLSCDGRIAILDWEAAAVLPVAADLSRLAIHHRAIEERVVAQLKQLPELGAGGAPGAAAERHATNQLVLFSLVYAASKLPTGPEGEVAAPSARTREKRRNLDRAVSFALLRLS